MYALKCLTLKLTYAWYWIFYFLCRNVHTKCFNVSNLKSRSYCYVCHRSPLHFVFKKVISEFPSSARFITSKGAVASYVTYRSNFESQPAHNDILYCPFVYVMIHKMDWQLGKIRTTMWIKLNVTRAQCIICGAMSEEKFQCYSNTPELVTSCYVEKWCRWGEC
jgi:hypothetical protein